MLRLKPRAGQKQKQQQLVDSDADVSSSLPTANRKSSSSVVSLLHFNRLRRKRQQSKHGKESARPLNHAAATTTTATRTNSSNTLTAKTTQISSSPQNSTRISQTIESKGDEGNIIDKAAVASRCATPNSRKKRAHQSASPSASSASSPNSNASSSQFQRIRRQSKDFSSESSAGSPRRSNTQAAGATAAKNNSNNSKKKNSGDQTIGGNKSISSALVETPKQAKASATSRKTSGRRPKTAATSIAKKNVMKKKSATRKAPSALSSLSSSTPPRSQSLVVKRLGVPVQVHYGMDIPVKGLNYICGFDHHSPSTRTSDNEATVNNNGNSVPTGLNVTAHKRMKEYWRHKRTDGDGFTPPEESAKGATGHLKTGEDANPSALSLELAYQVGLPDCRAFCQQNEDLIVWQTQGNNVASMLPAGGGSLACDDDGAGDKCDQIENNGPSTRESASECHLVTANKPLLVTDESSDHYWKRVLFQGQRLSDMSDRDLVSVQSLMRAPLIRALEQVMEDERQRRIVTLDETLHHHHQVKPISPPDSPRGQRSHKHDKLNSARSPQGGSESTEDTLSITQTESPTRSASTQTSSASRNRNYNSTWSSILSKNSRESTTNELGHSLHQIPAPPFVDDCDDGNDHRSEKRHVLYNSSKTKVLRGAISLPDQDISLPFSVDHMLDRLAPAAESSSRKEPSFHQQQQEGLEDPIRENIPELLAEILLEDGNNDTRQSPQDQGLVLSNASISLSSGQQEGSGESRESDFHSGNDASRSEHSRQLDDFNVEDDPRIGDLVRADSMAEALALALHAPADPQVTLGTVEILLFGMNAGRINTEMALQYLRKLPDDPVALAWLAMLLHPQNGYDLVGLHGVDEQQSVELLYQALERGIRQRATENDPRAMFLCGRIYSLFPPYQYQEQALEFYYHAAVQNCPQAQFQLGHVYRVGYGVEPNPDLAARYYKLAADQGMALAQYCLGRCYQSGHGTAKNEKKALRFFKRAAFQGDVNAQYMMGVCLQQGRGLPPSDRAAVAYYRLAALQGYARAQCHLGICYAQGLGIKQDNIKAVECYRLAAEQGLASALTNLGVCYAKGIGVFSEDGAASEPDLVQAVKYYKLAAHTDMNAQYNLGKLYQTGQGGLDRDLEKAIRYFMMASEKGHTQSSYLLGSLYLHGDIKQGIIPDPRLGIERLRDAAKHGHANAQCDLGVCYMQGLGVGKSLAHAIHWYQKAAHQGDARGQFMLGTCYDSSGDDEETCNADLPKAVHYYKLAADQGHANAQFNLACSYEEGLGVNRDQREAVRYYILAAEQNFARAQCNLGICYQYGVLDNDTDGRDGLEGAASATADPVEAVRLFHLAADKGNLARASYNLLLCYEEGVGVEKDLDQAVRYARQAAEQGSADAQCILGIYYEEGLHGVEQSDHEALRFYRLAAEGGDEEAHRRLCALQEAATSALPVETVAQVDSLEEGYASASSSEHPTIS